MAVTLAHLAKLETDPLRKYVITNLIRDAMILEMIPFVNVDSLTSVAVRWKTLPTVAFRSLNEGYTPNEGETEQVWESVYAFGGEIEMDRVFKKIKNTVTDLRRLQTDMKLKAMAYQFKRYWIDGDHATDSKGFEGLKKRVSNYPSRQSIYFAGAAAAALDPTASVANGRAYFNKLEEVVYKCNNGQGVSLFCNEGIYYGTGAVARYIQASGGNYLDVTRDAFDREVTTFKGARLVDMGFRADQSTEIIPDNETAGDAGTDATSIYGVAFNEIDGITGIQLDGLEAYDPLSGGERESKPTNLIRVEWWCGLAGFGSHGITRGRNVEGASNWT